MLYKAGVAMSKANGTLPVSQVAAAAHATVRTLERKFKQAAGHTVKDVSGLMRFEQVRNRIWHYPGSNLAGLAQWLKASQANILFENTSMDPHTGQPAIDYIRTALSAGVHVVTANKGPVVHAYHELRDLAAANGVRFLFEAAVMGGAPIFSLFREALPVAKLERFRGILNSTTNLILTELECGSSFEAAVKKAQDLGIAETDPSFDLDGWDATVKVSALATVLMDYPLKPKDVVREGIRGLKPDAVQSAPMMGRRYKLVCQAEKHTDGTVTATVRPEQLSNDDPLARVDGATSIVQFQMDVIHGLTLSELPLFLEDVQIAHEAYLSREALAERYRNAQGL